MDESPFLKTQHDKADSRFINCVFIICAGVFVFSPCLFNFFVSDDFDWIIRGNNLSFADLHHGFELVTHNRFRPLVPVSFSILHQVFGLSPFGYHLSSVVFHILNGLVFYKILLHFQVRKDVALISALIFVTHFAHEETVFWISSNCILLCWLFSLLSILTFLKWLREERIGLYFLSLGFSLIALLFREDALALPAILSFIIWFKYLRSKLEIANGFVAQRKSTPLTSLAPFFLVFFVYSYLRNVSLPHWGLVPLLSLNPTNLIRNFAYFLGNLIFPLRLVFDVIGYHYSRMINSAVNSMDSNATVVVISAFIVILLVFLFFMWFRKTNKNVKSLVIIFLIAISPFLLFKGYVLRFTYLPLLGFSPIAAYLLLSLVKRIASHNPWLETRHFYVSFIIIIVFNFLVLFERDLWWSKAGRISKETITNAGAVISSLPAGSTVCFMALPTRLQGAYIFNTSFVEAMTLFYPRYKHQIRTINGEGLSVLPEGDLKNYYLFKYENGEFFRVF